MNKVTQEVKVVLEDGTTLNYCNIQVDSSNILSDKTLDISSKLLSSTTQENITNLTSSIILDVKAKLVSSLRQDITKEVISSINQILGKYVNILVDLDVSKAEMFYYTLEDLTIQDNIIE